MHGVRLCAIEEPCAASTGKTCFASTDLLRNPGNVGKLHSGFCLCLPVAGKTGKGCMVRRQGPETFFRLFRMRANSPYGFAVTYNGKGAFFMSEQSRRSGVPVKLVFYCRNCAVQYGLPVGEKNRLPKPNTCELCGQIAVRYFTDKTVTAMVLGVDVDAIMEERALIN